MFSLICLILFTWSAQDASGECPPIIRRKEWYAVKPLHHLVLDLPVDLVVIQHTVTQACSDDQSCTKIVRKLQETHVNETFLWDIGPSFLVGGTGKLYEGRGWHHVAVHTPGYNNQSIGIAFIGNFDNQEPSSKALNSVQALIKCGVDEGRLSAEHKVVVHNQLLATESPGKKLSAKVMTWSDWTNDVSEIMKRADKEEFQPADQLTTNHQLRSGKDLALTEPKKIDLLSNQRDVIAELINNLAKLAHGTLDTIKALTQGMNKQVSLFVEALASGIKKLQDQVAGAFSPISGVPGIQKCTNSLKDKANSIYDDTERKAKECADRRVKEVDDMIKNLGALSSNAIDYSNTAVENTKNCTEVNYGIQENTKACLNSVTQQTKTASSIYESQRATALTSIETLLKALPAGLELCAKQHTLEGSKKTTGIASEILKCPTSSLGSVFGGFGF